MYKGFRLFKFSSCEEGVREKDLLKQYNEHIKNCIKSVTDAKNWITVVGTMAHKDPRKEAGKSAGNSSSSNSSSNDLSYTNKPFQKVLMTIAVDFLKSDYAMDDLMKQIGENPEGTESIYKEEFKPVQSVGFLKGMFKQAASEGFMEVGPGGLEKLKLLLGGDDYVETFAPLFFSNFEAYIRKYLHGDVAGTVRLLNEFFPPGQTRFGAEALADKLEKLLELTIEFDGTLAKFTELLVQTIRGAGFFAAFEGLPEDRFKATSFIARTVSPALVVAKGVWRALATAETAALAEAPDSAASVETAFAPYYRSFVDALAESAAAKMLRAKGAPDLDAVYNFCDIISAAQDNNNSSGSSSNGKKAVVPLLYAKLSDTAAHALAGLTEEITEITLGNSRLSGVLTLYRAYKEDAAATPYREMYTHYLTEIRKVGERVLYLVRRFQEELVTEQQARALKGKGKTIARICADWNIDCPAVTRVDAFAGEFVSVKADIVNIDATTNFLKNAEFTLDERLAASRPQGAVLEEDDYASDANIPGHSTFQALPPPPLQSAVSSSSSASSPATISIPGSPAIISIPGSLNASGSPTIPTVSISTPAAITIPGSLSTAGASPSISTANAPGTQSGPRPLRGRPLSGVGPALSQGSQSPPGVHPAVPGGAAATEAPIVSGTPGAQRAPRGRQIGMPGVPTTKSIHHVRPTSVMSKSTVLMPQSTTGGMGETPIVPSSPVPPRTHSRQIGTPNVPGTPGTSGTPSGPRPLRGRPLSGVGPALSQKSQSPPGVHPVVPAAAAAEAPIVSGTPGAQRAPRGRQIGMPGVPTTKSIHNVRPTSAAPGTLDGLSAIQQQQQQQQEMPSVESPIASIPQPITIQGTVPLALHPPQQTASLGSNIITQSPVAHGMTPLPPQMTMSLGSGSSSQFMQPPQAMTMSPLQIQQQQMPMGNSGAASPAPQLWLDPAAVASGAQKTAIPRSTSPQQQQQQQQPQQIAIPNSFFSQQPQQQPQQIPMISLSIPGVSVSPPAVTRDERDDENMLCGLKRKRDRLFMAYRVEGLVIEDVIYVVKEKMNVFQNKFKETSIERSKEQGDQKLNVRQIQEVYETVCVFFDKFFDPRKLRFNDIKEINERIQGDSGELVREVDLLGRTERFKGLKADIKSVSGMIQKAGELIEIKEKCKMLASFADSFRVCTAESVGALKSVLSSIKDDQTVEKAEESLETIRRIIGKFGPEHQKLADALLRSIDTVNFLRDYYIEGNFDRTLNLVREKHTGADFDMRMLATIELTFKSLGFIFDKMDTMAGTLGDFCKFMGEKIDKKQASAMSAELLEVNTHLNTIRVWFLTLNTSRITIETIMPFINDVNEHGVYESDATTLTLYVIAEDGNGNTTTKTPHLSSFINEIIRAMKIFTDVSKSGKGNRGQTKDVGIIKDFIETTKEAEIAFQLHKKLVRIGHPAYVTAAAASADDEDVGDDDEVGNDDNNGDKDGEESSVNEKEKEKEKESEKSTVLTMDFNKKGNFNVEAIRKFCMKEEEDYKAWTDVLREAAERTPRLKFLNNLQVLSLAHTLVQCAERKDLDNSDAEVKVSIRHTMNILPYVLLCFPEAATEIADSNDGKGNNANVEVITEIVKGLKAKGSRGSSGGGSSSDAAANAGIDAARELMEIIERKQNSAKLLQHDTAQGTGATGARGLFWLHVLGEQGSTPDKLYDCLEAIFQGAVHESLVLSCTSETSEEEVESFLGRVEYYNDARAVFAITHVNTVSLKVKECILEWARKMIQTKSSSRRASGALHVIFTAAQGSELFTDTFQRVDSVEELRERLRRARAEAAESDPGRTEKQRLRRRRVVDVSVFDSEPLSGKTTKVRAAMKGHKGRVVTVSVMEGFHPRECIKYMRRTVFAADYQGKDVALHFNVSPYAPLEHFGEFLYTFLRWGIISDQRSGAAMYMGPTVNWHVYIELGVAPQRDDECAFTSTKAVKQMLPLLDAISDTAPPPTEFDFSDPEVKACAWAFYAFHCPEATTSFAAFTEKRDDVMYRGTAEFCKPFTDYLESKSRFFAIRSRLARLMADRYRSFEEYLKTGSDNSFPGSQKSFPQLVEAVNTAIDEEVSQYTSSPLKGFTRFINFPAGSEPIIMDFAQDSQHQDPTDTTLGVMSLVEVCKDTDSMYGIVSAAFGVATDKCKNALESKKYVLTPDFALKLMFLNQCRRAGQNIVLSGDTGTGKSELLETFTRLVNLNTNAIPNVLEFIISKVVKGAATPVTTREELLDYLQAKFDSNRDVGRTISGIEMSVRDLYKKYPLRKKPLVRKILRAKKLSMGGIIDTYEDAKRVVTECLSAEVKLFHKVLMDQHITAEIFTDRVEKAMERAENSIKKGDASTVVIGFIDECTSTRIMGMVKEVLIDKTINGRPLPPNMMWIGAFNRNSMPNEEALLAKSTVAVKDFTGIGSAGGAGEAPDFAVRPPPTSLEILEVCFSRLNEEQQRFFLGKLLCLQAGKHELTEPGKEVRDAIIYAHGYVDRKHIQRVHPSIRDFVRCTTLYDYFCNHPCYFYDEDDPSAYDKVANGQLKVLREDKMIELHHFALVLAVTISYYFRMPHTLRQEFSDGYVKEGRPLPPKDAYTEKGDQAGNEGEGNNGGGGSSSESKDPFLEIFRFVALRLYRNTEYKKGIAATESFLENLFCTVVCIDAKIPLMIVGPPGCSKTLSFSLAMENMKGHQSRSAFYKTLSYVHPTRYQCSRDSTDKEIQEVYNIAIDQQRGYDEADEEASKAQKKINRKTRKPTISNNNNNNGGVADGGRLVPGQRCVVLLDEAGLPDERTAPLKILHYMLDHPKVSSIILSNCILDAAKTNRTALLIQDAPNDEDMRALVKMCVYGDEIVGKSAGEVVIALAEAYKALLKAQSPEAMELMDGEAPVMSSSAAALSHSMSSSSIGSSSEEALAAWKKQQQQQRNGVTKIAPIPEFFHLRDFVYFLRYLGREVKNKVDPMEPQVLVRALRRNFGGVEERMFREVVAIFGDSANMMQDVVPRRTRADYIAAIEQTSVIEALRESLNEKVEEDEDVNMAPIRFVLVVDPSDSEVAVSILFDQGLCDKNATDICHIADFAEDSTESARENAIIRVKNAMEDSAGKTMILMNPMPISSSFYDVFNRHFDVIKTKDGKGYDYFARIAIGSYSRPCVVSPSFKLIVHLPLSLLKRTPAPFLNRFEKYYLSLGNILGNTLAALKPSAADAPLNELAYGAKDMTSRFGGRETFFGLVPEETINSLVLPVAEQVRKGVSIAAAIPPVFHINKEAADAVSGAGDEDDNNDGNDEAAAAKRRNIRKLNFWLLQLARPECILELAKGPLPVSYLREYALAQEHFSLARALQKLSAMAAGAAAGAPPMKWCVFTRASSELIKLRTSAALQRLLFGPLADSVHVVQLEYLTSSRECEREVEEPGKDVLVCLANMQKCTSDQTSLVRTLIDSSKEPRRLVAIVLYYPPEMQVQDSSQVCQAVFFNNWNYFYVDSLGVKPDNNGGYQLIDSHSWLTHAYKDLSGSNDESQQQQQQQQQAPDLGYFCSRITEQIARLVGGNPRASFTQSVLANLPYSAQAYSGGMAQAVGSLISSEGILECYARSIYDAWCNGFVEKLLDAECTAIQEGRQHYGIFEGLDRCLSKLFLPAARTFLETFCADLSLEGAYRAFDTTTRSPDRTQAEMTFMATVLKSACICDAEDLRSTTLEDNNNNNSNSGGDDGDDNGASPSSFLGSAFTTPSYLPLFSIVYKRVRAALSRAKETCHDGDNRYMAFTGALSKDPAVAAVEEALANSTYLRTLYTYDLVVWGFHLPELYVPPSVLENDPAATLWLDICSRCIGFYTTNKASIIEMHVALELSGEDISALLSRVIPLHALTSPPMDFGNVPDLLGAQYSTESAAALSAGIVAFCVYTIGSSFTSAIRTSPTAMVNAFTVYRDARSRGLTRAAVATLTNNDPTLVITLDVLEVAYLFSMYIGADDLAQASTFASTLMASVNPSDPNAPNGIARAANFCMVAASACTSPEDPRFRIFLENTLLYFLESPTQEDFDILFASLVGGTQLAVLLPPPSLAQFLAKWLDAHPEYRGHAVQRLAGLQYTDPPSLLNTADYPAYNLYLACLDADLAAKPSLAEKVASLRSTAENAIVYPSAIVRTAVVLAVDTLCSAVSDAAALRALQTGDPDAFFKKAFNIAPNPTDVRDLFCNHIHSVYKLLEVCSWKDSLGYLGLDALYSSEAEMSSLTACMLPMAYSKNYDFVEDSSNGTNSINFMDTMSRGKKKKKTKQ